jgi:hypothetical protein
MTPESRSAWTAKVAGSTTCSSSGCGGVKYEEVYLHAYANGTEARSALTRYFNSYNAVRLHQCLEYRTPDEVYFRALANTMPAAA